ncbi:MAG: glutamate formimidoyltransferase, partial [Candidatus Dadabacteria bacterium]
MKIVECVPNISEGRDREKIDKIANSALVGSVRMLDIDPGTATNRTVITFAGEPEDVLQGAFELAKAAYENIDMTTHTGEHPRMGAVDVIPFVPVQGVSMEECAELARRLGQMIGQHLQVPVYLYEYAASKPERKSLSAVRQGEYEALPEKLKDPSNAPDFGPAEFVPSFGAVAVGARQFLIAYNINLNTKNKKLASQIAVRLRESGYKKRDQNGKFVYDADGNPVMEPGRFKHCKAVGWFIEEFGIAQVSINLTDFTVTPMHAVFDEACKLAEERGLRVTGSEIVGLVPKEALLDSGRYYLKKQGASLGIPEREIMQVAVKSLGLSELYDFKIKEKVIEERVLQEKPLATMPLAQFIDTVSTDAPAPGGGS